VNKDDKMLIRGNVILLQIDYQYSWNHSGLTSWLVVQLC